MDNKYYIIWFRIDNKDSYLIWYSNNNDRVLTNKNGKVLNFSSIQEVSYYALNNGFYLESDEPTFYNLDRVIKWIKEGDAKTIDCKELNSVWNLFEDISQSVYKAFNSTEKKVNDIYDKLFWGCNLPSVTPKDKSYEPEWNENEIKILKNILGSGIKIFKDSL